MSHCHTKFRRNCYPPKLCKIIQTKQNLYTEINNRKCKFSAFSGHRSQLHLCLVRQSHFKRADNAINWKYPVPLHLLRHQWTIVLASIINVKEFYGLLDQLASKYSASLSKKKSYNTFPVCHMLMTRFFFLLISVYLPHGQSSKLNHLKWLSQSPAEMVYASKTPQEYFQSKKSETIRSELTGNM